MTDLTERDLGILRLAPLWALSAIVGRQTFHPMELAAFWGCVERAADRSVGLARDVLTSILDDSDRILAEYRHEVRPVASGLTATTQILDRVPFAESLAFRRILVLDIVEGVARARGPFGMEISRDDSIATEVVAVLLGLEAETSGPWLVPDVV